jgi:hypothetical protein
LRKKLALALTRGNNSPAVKTPRRGPLLIATMAMFRGMTPPKWSTIKFMARHKIPVVITMSFKTVHLVFSVIVLGNNFDKKSSYMVPAKQFRFADKVLQ